MIVLIVLKRKAINKVTTRSYNIRKKVTQGLNIAVGGRNGDACVLSSDTNGPNFYFFLFAIMHRMMIVAEEKYGLKYHEQCTVFTTSTPSVIFY